MSAESSDASFQTKTELRRKLEAAGLAPRKRYGQHFLIDRNLMNKLMDSADVGPADCIVEVGAGTGSLTGLLAKRAGRVVAAEIDDGLARLAGEHLARFDNVVLLHVDALERKSAISPQLHTAIHSAHATAGGVLKMVANLPYDIATPLVIDLLLADLPFGRMCFTVQVEVADRFFADPGTADYGPVSIIVRLLAVGRRICRVPPQAFWPVPKVDSAMVRLDIRTRSQIPVADPADFAGFVRSFFRHRRKSLGRTARQLEQPDRFLAALGQVGIEAKSRPEAVSLQQWLDLYRAAR